MKVNKNEQKVKAYLNFGTYLRFCRLRRGFLQEELGSLLGYQPTSAKQAISQMENGKTWIPQQKLPELIRLLDLNRSDWNQLTYYHTIGDYEQLDQRLMAMLKRDFDIDPQEDASLAQMVDESSQESINIISDFEESVHQQTFSELAPQSDVEALGPTHLPGQSPQLTVASLTEKLALLNRSLC